jgi:hypothetical protein
LHFLSFFLSADRRQTNFFLSNIDSPYHRCGKLTTLRISDAGSRRLSQKRICAVVIKKILMVYYCVCVGLIFTLFHFWGTLPCGSHLLYRETQSVGNQIQICSFSFRYILNFILIVQTNLVDSFFIC